MQTPPIIFFTKEAYFFSFLWNHNLFFMILNKYYSQVSIKQAGCIKQAEWNILKNS